MTRVCAVVPLYNEEEKAAITINSLRSIRSVTDIVVIDDGSSDRTWDVISSIENITLLRHMRNMGKAASISDGVKACDADIYLFADGDLGKSAQNLGPLIESVANGECDMCVAKFPDMYRKSGMGILKSFSKFIVKRMAGINFPCPLSGQRALKRELVKDIRIRFYSGFGIDVGMLIDAVNSGYSVKYMELELEHTVTLNDIKGYFHRFRQFMDVLWVITCRYSRW